MTTRAIETMRLASCDVDQTKLLMVGSGGIGCELLKNLLLTGFTNLTIIDLDTIDVSNLNRQFLFRKIHVDRPKAHVAKEQALQFPHDNPMHLKALHDNIKQAEYDLHFFKTFDIVLNALDNVDARRHVNRMCLAANVPLVESGTAGYLGQVRAILKGRTKCFECDPIPPPKSYPVCTIRNHPSKDVHCIAWAKELLFKRLFGGEETDLIDANEAEAEGGGAAEDDATAPPAGGAMGCREGEEPLAYARRVFEMVFGADVRRLLEMESLWKE